MNMKKLVLFALFAVSLFAVSICTGCGHGKEQQAKEDARALNGKSLPYPHPASLHQQELNKAWREHQADLNAARLEKTDPSLLGESGYRD